MALAAWEKVATRYRIFARLEPGFLTSLKTRHQISEP
jgi:hypothetical protein